MVLTSRGLRLAAPIGAGTLGLLDPFGNEEGDGGFGGRDPSHRGPIIPPFDDPDPHGHPGPGGNGNGSGDQTANDGQTDRSGGTQANIGMTLSGWLPYLLIGLAVILGVMTARR